MVELCLWLQSNGLGKCSRWSLALLGPWTKLYSLKVCDCILIKFQKYRDLVLNHIIIADQTWVHYSTPEPKQASNDWRQKGEPGPVKAKWQLIALKFMAIVLFNRRGLLCYEFFTLEHPPIVWTNHLRIL